MEIPWGIVPCFRSSDFYKFRRCIEINVPTYNISSSSSLIMFVVTSKCFETRVPHLLSYLVYFILNLLRIFVSSISIFLSLTFSSFSLVHHPSLKSPFLTAVSDQGLHIVFHQVSTGDSKDQLRLTLIQSCFTVFLSNQNRHEINLTSFFSLNFLSLLFFRLPSFFFYAFPIDYTCNTFDNALRAYWEDIDVIKRCPHRCHIQRL